MIPSNTICVSQEGPANALALNKDCSQVVIAGRNVFKVFSIGENEFTEVSNLRVGKNLNLNFSSIDVAWSALEENTIATAATNGAVVVWNLSRSGRSKQEHVFSDHKRTVNKVSFHLTEPALLISGSQDGTMKCFDLRMKEVARTYMSNTESVRDVQFSPHGAQQFAAVSENGTVQLWDARRPERALAQFTAHSGPVFACDWHPDLPWLATASRDKTIKVWDIQGKPTLEHTIYTIASVGHVKWRPQRKYQVSSCALVLDCSVHVWDVRRPHVPLATFAEHRDVTTAIAWQAGPQAFLSTSRDCSLYRHRWSEAAHPVLWASPQGACVSARGEVAQAARAAPMPAAGALLPRKQPRAGALSAGAQAELERAFPLSAQSVLARWQLPRSPLALCAARYRTRGAPAAALARHNAGVARALDRHLVAHTFDMIAAVFAEEEPGDGGQGEDAEPAPPRPAPPAAAAPRPAPPPPLPEEERGEREEGAAEDWAEGWAEGVFHNSGVLGLPSHTIYVPPARLARRPPGEGWVSAASAHYVDEDAHDWTLPEEAFPLRAAAPPAPPAPPAPAAAPARAPRPAPPAASPGGSSGDDPAPPPPLPPAAGQPRTYSNQSSLSTLEEPEAATGPDEPPLLAAGAGGGWRRARRWEAHAALARALQAHAALGDVQTPCVALLLLGRRRAALLHYIDEAEQEAWLLGYVEQLRGARQTGAALAAVRGAWLAPVWALSQQSTTIGAACARCGRRRRAAGAAEGGCACAPAGGGAACAVCRRAVRGLYAWCQGCAHGGHLLHMQRWMAQHRLCPAGCGHHCQLP